MISFLSLGVNLLGHNGNSQDLVTVSSVSVSPLSSLSPRPAGGLGVSETSEETTEGQVKRVRDERP